MKNNTVLFVDDDTHIISSLRRGLMDEEYKKEFAYSGEQALNIMENTKVSVIVTDMRMPKMNGLTLLKIISEKYPDVVKVVLSGYTQLPQILATINQVNIFKFVTKPWNLEDELIPIIRQSIEYYNFASEKEKMKAEIERKNTLYTQILKSSNEKFAIMHKDYENIKTIDKNIFNYIRSQSTQEDPKLFHYHLAFIEKTHRKYMNTLPTVNSQFDFKKIITELSTYISENHPENPVDIQLKDNKNIQFSGNYKLLITYLMHFIKHTLNQYHSLKLTLSGENSKNVKKLFFIMELSQNTSSEKNLLSLIPSFNLFCEIINGKFDILKENADYKVLSFKVEF
ncbi:MAG: response regulator [Marinisporobacter sp.]|jgi:CheY-like chemotaxis protein|nr:response regulator [Marinisporobacter sp.]